MILFAGALDLELEAVVLCGCLMIGVTHMVRR